MISSASASIPFRSPESALGALDADVTARALAAASDMALVVDASGTVVDLSVGGLDLAAAGLGDWLDQTWTDLVAADSRLKAEELLLDALGGRAPRWRELNHPLPGGANLPMRWFALGGQDGRVVLIGRDLQAAAALQQRLLQVQQSMERDYAKLRQAESRWRLLFQTSSEPIVVIDAGTRRVREGNAAAWRLLGVTEELATGKPVAELVGKAGAEVLNRLFAGAPAGSAPAEIALRDGGLCGVSASLFRHDKTSLFLVRLSPRDGRTLDPERDAERRLARLVDRIPDAFVVTDRSLRILSANAAFAEAVALPTPAETIGQPLDRFLGRPHIDLKVILAQLEEHGSVRNVATVLHGAHGETEDVEVTAVSAADAEPPSYGFSLRLVARRLAPSASPAGAADAPRSVEQMTQLIGRVPMKEIVRESTDLIERLCIEAALTLTGNNRASAADLLGLSRQSLYLKLRRYGVIGPDAPEE